MASTDPINETTALLSPNSPIQRTSHPSQPDETQSLVESAVSKEELLLGDSMVGERLPWNNYTTIDFQHDLVLLTGSRCWLFA